MLIKPLKVLKKACVVFLSRAAGNESIIEIDEHFVHKRLERLSGIFKVKRHTQKLKESKQNDDGGLVNVVWMDRYLVVAAYQIDLRKYSGTVKIRCEVLDVGNMMPISCCSLI